MIVICPTCQHEHGIRSLEQAEFFYNKLNAVPSIRCNVHSYHPLKVTKQSNGSLTVESCDICVNDAAITAVGEANDRSFGW